MWMADEYMPLALLKLLTSVLILKQFYQVLYVLWCGNIVAQFSGNCSDFLAALANLQEMLRIFSNWGNFDVPTYQTN